MTRIVMIVIKIDRNHDRDQSFINQDQDRNRDHKKVFIGGLRTGFVFL